MSVRYVLAPEAALDLIEIWRYIKKNTSVEMADRIEIVILERIGFLADAAGSGHCCVSYIIQNPVARLGRARR